MDLRSEIPEQYWELIDTYRDELLQQASAILGSHEDAEDVVQETFCEAFRDGQKIAQADSIGVRLRLINRRNALNRRRTRGRAQKKINRKQQQAPTRAFTTGGFSHLEVRDAVRRALETLPENLRQLVELRYFEHRSLSEIAEQLQMPLGTVGRLLSEASVQLYGKLACFTPHDAAAKPSDRPSDEQSSGPVTAEGTKP